MANSNFRLDFSRKDVFECCLCALRGAGLCLPSHKVHVLGGRPVLLLPKPVYLASSFTGIQFDAA